MTDDARRRYLAEGNARQARKRVAADAVIRDEQGRVLLVDPGYKPDWDLPGGMAEANEPPIDTVRRELREELGLELTVGPLLHLVWVPPRDPWDDQLVFLFDGGTLTDAQTSELRLVDGELRAWDFVTVDDAKSRLRPYVYERLLAALDSLAAGRASSYREARRQAPRQ
ncbi:MAG: NUDIX domain-containing protein [Streptosporangiales bacterium]|nr:NUDIX domain-containing protein [Streptosporangiales bacterium]